MPEVIPNEVIRDYLKGYLKISIEPTWESFNGKRLTIKLKLGDEVIDQDSISVNDIREDF